MSPEIEKISKAARAGGEILKKYFGEILELTQKTTAADFRTKADLQSETAILEVLEKEFPEYNIISEEKGEIKKNSDYTFVIDPLDGTSNFASGIPNFSVSIGLLYKDEIVAGIIYAPMIDNIYYAEKGKGAFLDGQKLRVSQELNIKNASICHNCGYVLTQDDEMRIIGSLYAKGARRVMTNWSVAFDFCLLASGRVQAIYNNKCCLHDFAAGKLIAKEAGALITDFHGRTESSDKNNGFIASNGAEIHKYLIGV